MANLSNDFDESLDTVMIFGYDLDNQGEAELEYPVTLDLDIELLKESCSIRVGRELRVFDAILQDGNSYLVNSSCFNL